MDEALTERGFPEEHQPVFIDRPLVMEAPVYFDCVRRLSGNFLVDPDEIDAETLWKNKLQYHSLATLARAAGVRISIPPENGRSARKLLFDDPELEGILETHCFQPRQLNECFFSVAKMLQLMRYRFLGNNPASLRVPALAREGSVTTVFLLVFESPWFLMSPPVDFRILHQGYLAPGKYYNSDFGLELSGRYRYVFAGYLDFAGTMEYFDVSSM
ncbi:MAG: hypothetical protein MJ016_07595 [Victivallaceae bacterium]|nr:hypothetical protein [Victivallaceae bacterium]